MDIPDRCRFLPDDNGNFTVTPSKEWEEEWNSTLRQISRYNALLNNPLEAGSDIYERSEICVELKHAYRTITGVLAQQIGDCESLCMKDGRCSAFSYKLEHPALAPVDFEYRESGQYIETSRLGTFTNYCHFFDNETCDKFVDPGGTGVYWGQDCVWSRCYYMWDSANCSVINSETRPVQYLSFLGLLNYLDYVIWIMITSLIFGCILIAACVKFFDRQSAKAHARMASSDDQNSGNLSFFLPRPTANDSDLQSVTSRYTTSSGVSVLRPRVRFNDSSTKGEEDWRGRQRWRRGSALAVIAGASSYDRSTEPVKYRAPQYLSGRRGSTTAMNLSDLLNNNLDTNDIRWHDPGPDPDVDYVYEYVSESTSFENDSKN